MKTHPIATAAIFAAVAMGTALTGCAGNDSSEMPGRDSTSPARPDGPATSPPHAPEPTTAPSDEEHTLRIEITVDGQRFGADLSDSPASHDLLAQLPQTIEMRDHGGVEKTGPLRAPLSLEGQPSGADPDIGDVGYFAPTHDLVLYYGDQSYFPGIVILGRMEDGAADRIAQMDGEVTTTVVGTN